MRLLPVKLLPVFILTMTLAGCGSPIIKPLPPMLHQTPVGSIIQLNQPLTVPSQRSDTGIQFGKPVLAVDQYEPHCRFKVNTLNDNAITLPPGDYKVTKVVRFSDPFYSQAATVKLAAAGSNLAWMAMGSASPDSFWYYTTVLYLDSAAYPDIRELTCGAVYASGFEARDITLAEFEQAVGDVVKLRKPMN